MTIFFFTASGNSLKVSKAFITSDCVSISSELRKSPGNYTDDKIGFVFPSYFYGIPRPVLKFIRRSDFNSSYFFTIITCGSTSGATSLQLQNELKKKGISLNYAVEITTINNYVPMFDINKEIYTQSKKNIESILPAAVHDIRASVNRIPSFGILAKFSHTIAQIMYNRMLDKCDKNL
ncbi:MAG TPA: EFR1 family ferrodoxin, partial [Spirochaetota bacterium]|nr:EFR1 family ferrodoxin [Spirochaetota bacterium]